MRTSTIIAVFREGELVEVKRLDFQTGQYEDLPLDYLRHKYTGKYDGIRAPR